MNLKVLSECGTCDACCSILAIQELGKPYYTRCEHQIGQGCGIYGQHPASCRSYKCFYLQGIVKRRPNESGFLIHAAIGDGNGPVIEVFEVIDKPDYAGLGYELQRIMNRSTKVAWDCIKIHRFGSSVGTLFDLDGSKYDDSSQRSGNLGVRLEESKVIFVVPRNMTVESVKEWKHRVEMEMGSL